MEPDTMIRRTLSPLLLLAALAAPAAPAFAGSQSSDQNSKCSDGRCTFVDTRRFEDRGRQWGWQRIEQWDERQRWQRPPRHDPRYQGYTPGRRPDGRRGRDDDDDD
jgi:hypothetical protein